MRGETEMSVIFECAIANEGVREGFDEASSRRIDSGMGNAMILGD